ncbi:MAG: diaminopimelate epimerase [Candidatus Omnitrophica bacterium]|nr:diaminopimelate epimerase [Candidatus Omnitrophota bacterium]
MSDFLRPMRYSGTGNTFVIVDVRAVNGGEWAETAQRVCSQYSVDGLLLMEKSSKADIRMRIFNPDGSEASMCGNGSRCAAHYAANSLALGHSITMETLAGVLEARVEGVTVKVLLTPPRDIRPLTGYQVPGQAEVPIFLNTGVPHVVTEVGDLSHLDVVGVGRGVRRDERFLPEGTNASFFQKEDGNRISVRVYERGVESETVSCGTGSTACALVAAERYRLSSPVEVNVSSGERLRIHFESADDGFRRVFLEGEVRVLGPAEVQPPLSSGGSK